MIDNLVVKVFVDDGYATVHIKLGNATEVADIRLKEVKIALEHLFTSVQTQSPLARQGLGWKEQKLLFPAFFICFFATVFQ